jgi:fucose 4-O-acetylase-like acetyltransferase
VRDNFHYGWVDTVKGLGIILVVFAHTLRGLVKNDVVAQTPTTQFVDAWIYAFHMPLFFFVSGLLLFRSMEKQWTQFASDKLRRIAYPYFVWSLITLIIKVVLGTTTTYPYKISDLPLILYKPIDQFWFLYTLFLLLMVIPALIKLGLKPWGVLILASLLHPGLLPSSSSEWGVLFQTRIMAIYFALGVLLGSDETIQATSGLQARWLAICAVIGLVVPSLSGWSELPYRQAIRPALAFSGIAGTAAFALLLGKVKPSAALQFLGRHSLEIYVVHTIASAGVRITFVNLAHITAPAPHLVLGTLAGLYVPILLVLVFKRIRFDFGFTFPKPLASRNSDGVQRLDWKSMHMSSTVVGGWIIALLGTGLWLYGCFTTGYPSLVDWHANTPWWVADFLPNIESEVGMALVFGSMVPIYWSPRR